MKHITKTLAVVSLLVPISAQPLGIGDIQLHSALNQKLNAEIHLHLAAGENPADVTVRLAPPEKFDQAGVAWNYFLSKIKFNPVVQPDGSVIVKVTSREPLTEPFLDFLLEVSWPQGSQFREFTVLVDPPEAYRPPAIPSAASSDYRVEPLEDYQAPARKTPSGRKRLGRIQSAAHITPQTPTSGEYGPTQTADTLWRIAQQLGSERDVPTQQMMAALYQANPDAFNRGDMDSLKTGVVLKIPETDAILQASDSRGDKKPARKAPSPSASTNKTLELIAPADSKIADNSGQVKPGLEGADGAAGGGTGTGATDGKDLALQTRIERLEQQLNMMQQLLALKDQQLAALQSNDKETAQQAAESAQNLPAPQPIAPTPEPQAPAQPAALPAEQAAAVPPPPTPADVKPAPAQEPVKPVKPTPPPAPAAVEEESDFFSSPSYYLSVGGLSAGIMGLLGWLLWRKRKIESQTNTESMFATASQIRMPDSDSSLSVPVMDINSTGAYDVGTVGESSFISDFTPSDFEAFDTDQSDIDPMSEADVYLAYGRYQQAEDLIRHAISDQPNKDEYKLKLLEIFYANENKERFAEYVQQLADAGKKDDRSFWGKVSDMAKEIIPESALFGGMAKTIAQHTDQAENTHHDKNANETAASAPANFAVADDFEPADNSDDLIDLKAPTLPDMELMDEVDSELAEMQLTQPEESDDNSLDFDLGSFSTPEEKTPQAGASAETIPDIESIDFDLSGLSMGVADKSDEEPTADDTLESFDFNFDLDSAGASSKAPDNASSPASVQEPLDMASLESFEFPEFGDDEPEEAKPAQEPALSVGMDTLDTSDEFDFNFDFVMPGSEKTDDDTDFGVSDLTDMDEFETKIDLAKAYIDMGDADAAKAIAEEVLAKGNAEQKQTAQALLDELK